MRSTPAPRLAAHRLALVGLAMSLLPAVVVAGCKKTEDPLPMPGGADTTTAAGTTAAPGAGGAPAGYVPPPMYTAAAGAGGGTSITVKSGPPGTPTTFILPQGSVSVIPGVSGAPPSIQLPPGLTIPTNIPLPPGFALPTATATAPAKK